MRFSQSKCFCTNKYIQGKVRWLVCSVEVKTANRQCLFRANVKHIRGRHGRWVFYNGHNYSTFKTSKKCEVQDYYASITPVGGKNIVQRNSYF